MYIRTDTYTWLQAWACTPHDTSLLCQVCMAPAICVSAFPCVRVQSSGYILSCDQAFTDYFGYRHEDLQQEEMAALVTDPIALNKCEGLQTRAQRPPFSCSPKHIHTHA
jgi:hypothetical protein